jgi:hypothetical protein
MNKITKISTLVKQQMKESPVAYKRLRDKTLEQIVNSNPKMNVHVTIMNKPF